MNQKMNQKMSPKMLNATAPAVMQNAAEVPVAMTDAAEAPAAMTDAAEVPVDAAGVPGGTIVATAHAAMTRAGTGAAGAKMSAEETHAGAGQRHHRRPPPRLRPHLRHPRVTPTAQTAPAISAACASKTI